MSHLKFPVPQLLFKWLVINLLAPNRALFHPLPHLY